MDTEMTPWEGENLTDDELTAFERARERVDGWSREKSAASNLLQTELGLLKMILTASAYEKLKDHLFWRVCTFIDEEEALDHVAAYHEAKDLGMSTDFNLDYLFALCSANRKISHTNLISEILGSLSSFRYITNQPKDGKRAARDSERGPLSG